MTVRHQEALADILDYLRTLSREGVRPAEARTRLRLLQEQHPDTRLDLLWEERVYDDSVHYDILLRLDGEGTVSLSYCPERALPWPLRGVQRWDENELVRVNQTTLEVDQVVACLDFIWDEAPIINRLVDACLIREALEKDPIELSDPDLQCAMDAFRRGHNLYSAEATRQWMEGRGMTHEKLERLVGDQVLVAKLRDRVTTERVEVYFQQHGADFDTAHVARIKCPDEQSGRQTWEQIRGGGVDFYEAAQDQFLAAGSTPQATGSLFAVLRRNELPPDAVTAIFNAAPGEVLPPVRTEQGYAIVRVLALTPARLDEATRHTIKKILFEEWLEARRRAATIEWYWGNASRTSREG